MEKTTDDFRLLPGGLNEGIEPVATPENRFMLLATGERPQARMERLGAGALSEWELVATMLGAGGMKRDTITIAQVVLREAGSLAGLAQWRASDWASVKGVGPVVAAQCAGMMEVTRRIMAQSGDEMPLLNRADLVYGFMQPKLLGLEVEKFWVLVLNRKNRLIKCCEVTSGTATSALAHPREVFRAVIREAGTAVVCVHNHPSGDPTPSAADMQITRQLREAAKAVDIDLLDHVICGRVNADPCHRGYYSFREGGLL